MFNSRSSQEIQISNIFACKSWFDQVGTAVPELLLAAYCVAAEDQAGLRQKQLKLRQAQSEQQVKVERLKGEVASAKAQVGPLALLMPAII